MSPEVHCPNCGAAVRFRWSGAVQTSCEFCRSILVRHDLVLERVGAVADLPDAISPIQVLTEGAYRGRSFTVTGRILFEYEEGRWSVWHLVFSDSSSGWLSDREAEYIVSFLKSSRGAPAPDSLERAAKLRLNGTAFEVTWLARAHCRATEGELPFEFWDRDEVYLADLEDHAGAVATLAYPGGPPLLFVGEAVGFEDLRLSNLRPIEGWS
jgi:hypothetical protein